MFVKVTITLSLFKNTLEKSGNGNAKIERKNNKAEQEGRFSHRLNSLQMYV